MFDTLIKNSDILKKIIIINILVFIFIKLIKIFISPIYHEQIINLLALSSNFDDLLKSPWKIVSYMFVHHDIFHLTTNLLLLYFFGSIYVNYLSEKSYNSNNKHNFSIFVENLFFKYFDNKV